MMLAKESFICDTTDLGEDGLEIGKLYDYDIITRPAAARYGRL
jgi:two-component system cell cycle response regulator CtrA